MKALRILIVAHGHPEIYVGGAEVFAYELFRGFRATEGVDALLLARTSDRAHAGRQGTPFRAHRGRKDEVLWFPGDHDDVFYTLHDKSEYGVALRELLEVFRPHVIHVQHTSGLGFGLLREIRRGVPDAALVYTLHEFLPICLAAGLMLRKGNGELCRAAEPTACHGCFPNISPAQFWLRRRFVRAQLATVDAFVAPSHFLRQRFVEWGLPEDRVVFEEYGRLPIAALPDPVGAAPVGEFAFLGQLAPHKGLLVLLEAMRILRSEGLRGVRLTIHGSNLESQPEDFQRRFHELLAECGTSVRYAGPYATEDIPGRLQGAGWVIVPSTWWENSPLVIQEAFALGRPVVCADIGGMAEKVRDGVDGLHFKVGDPVSLAAVLRRAVASPDLWWSLRSGIQPVHTMAETLAFHLDLYRGLLERRRSEAVR